MCTQGPELPNISYADVLDGRDRRRILREQVHLLKGYTEL